MRADESGCVELAFLADEGVLLNRCRAGEPVADPMVVLALPTPADAQAVVASVDWASACLRYTEAGHSAIAPFAAQQVDVMDGVNDSADGVASDTAKALLLDVRRAGMLGAANTMLPGALWRDPTRGWPSGRRGCRPAAR